MGKEIMDIIYLTDGMLDQDLSERCREMLLSASIGHRIISVSQSPIDFGDNICVGNIGRSPESIERQILAGVDAATSKWVAIAEHDCVYSSEHFSFIPSDERFFWYNENVWILRIDDGQFSILRGRKIQSQMICERSLLIEATKDKLQIVGSKGWKTRYPMRPVGEPGVADYLKTMHRVRRIPEIQEEMISYLTKYASKSFTTKTPNIDIRHGKNLTGMRRGRSRTLSLPPWGTKEDILRRAA
jgi:hypothetical protein